MEALIGADFPKALVPLLDGAKKNIDICMYDWRWYPNQPGHPVQQFNNALVRARRRGVVVRCLCHTERISAVLSACGLAPRTVQDRRTLHAKLILIDGRTLVIGSHNITRNAFSHNLECSLVVELPEVENRFQTFFNNLYGL